MAIVRRGGGERGASLLEFAIILPIFMMLVLGMFSGGVAYNKKQEMTHASREGARFGATLRIVNTSTGTAWANSVRNVVVDQSNGELATGDVCVAFVGGANGTSVYARADAPGQPYTTATSGFPQHCFDDNDTATSGYRVHVAVRATAKIEALFFSIDRPLTSRSIARYERVVPTPA